MGEISKLAKGLSESLQEIRIVKIGKCEFIKTENKGKNKRRIYIKRKDV